MSPDTVNGPIGPGIRCWGLLAVAVVLAGLASPARAGETAAGPPASLGAETCIGCHNGARLLEIFRTPHGQGTDPSSPMAQAQCEHCHGTGSEHAERRSLNRPIIAFGPGSDTSVGEQDAICMGCHDDDVGPAWAGSVHERNDAGCAYCHTVHATVDPARLRAGQADVCFTCHQQQRADSRKPSAHPVRADDPVRVAAMVCTDCHHPHTSPAANLLRRNTLNELCFDCHAEFRGPLIFEHAPVSEDCSLCHQAHGSIHPALLTRRPPLLCQSCHSARGHPSLSYTDGSLPGGNPTAMVPGRSCTNCHTRVHGTNHPSGAGLLR